MNYMDENKIYFALFAFLELNFCSMKTTRLLGHFFGVLTAATLTFSCSDTNTYYAEIPVNESVDAPPVSGQFNKNVLLEDYTGTWCGNCTRVSYGIEQVLANSDRAVVVAIHNGNDPYHFANYQPLKDLISPNHDLELPQARMNRIIDWVDPDTNTHEAINLTSNNCAVGIAMNSVVANGQIDLDVHVKVTQNFSDLKLVLYVLENGLLYRQINYSSIYYGGVHVLQNFEHNHVLRSSFTDLLGDPIGPVTFGQTFTRKFTLPIPSSVANAANISFVAIVTDSNNLAVNSREAHPNEDQAFQENP